MTQRISHDDQFAHLQTRYPFTQPLAYYLYGKSGNPEAQAQKAFIHCLMTEFPEELGRVLIPQKATPNMPKELYTRLIVSVADFYDRASRSTKDGKRFSRQMHQYKAMGYQDGTFDITILYPCSGFHGFLCEMKHGGGHYTVTGNIAKPGAASKEQRLTMIELRNVGYYACIGKGFPDALHHWLNYLLSVLSSA